MVYWGRRSDRRQERKFHTWFPYIITAFGWVLATFQGSPAIQLIGICFASSGAFTAMALFWTTPDQSITLRARAVGIAVINAVGNLGSASGPFLIGMLYDVFGTYEAGIYALIILLVLGALTVMAIPMKQSRPSALP